MNVYGLLRLTGLIYLYMVHTVASVVLPGFSFAFRSVSFPSFVHVVRCRWRCVVPTFRSFCTFCYIGLDSLWFTFICSDLFDCSAFRYVTLVVVVRCVVIWFGFYCYFIVHCRLSLPVRCSFALLRCSFPFCSLFGWLVHLFYHCSVLLPCFVLVSVRLLPLRYITRYPLRSSFRLIYVADFRFLRFAAVYLFTVVLSVLRFVAFVFCARYVVSFCRYRLLLLYGLRFRFRCSVAMERCVCVHAVYCAFCRVDFTLTFVVVLNSPLILFDCIRSSIVVRFVVLLPSVLFVVALFPFLFLLMIPLFFPIPNSTVLARCYFLFVLFVLRPTFDFVVGCLCTALFGLSFVVRCCCVRSAERSAFVLFWFLFVTLFGSSCFRWLLGCSDLFVPLFLPLLLGGFGLPYSLWFCDVRCCSRFLFISLSCSLGVSRLVRSFVCSSRCFTVDSFCFRSVVRCCWYHVCSWYV